MANTHIHNVGPFTPLKLFKQGSQSLYSKTKVGLDGATQLREILRILTGALKWEQKLVVETLKTVS